MRGIVEIVEIARDTSHAKSDLRAITQTPRYIMTPALLSSCPSVLPSYLPDPLAIKTDTIHIFEKSSVCSLVPEDF